MTQIVNIHEAKTHLSRLLLRVMGGEEIIIARAGKPIARLLPINAQPAARAPGSAGNTISIPPSYFDALPDDFLESFGE